MVAGDGDSKLWLRVLAVQTLVLPFFVWTICFFGTSKRIWTWKTSNSGLWMMVSLTWMCISNFVLPPCIPWVLHGISLETPGLRGAASRVALGDEHPRSWAVILSVIGRMGGLIHGGVCFFGWVSSNENHIIYWDMLMKYILITSYSNHD